MVITEKTLKIFCSDFVQFCWLGIFEVYFISEDSKVCHLMEYGSTYLPNKNYRTKSIFFPKNMENMMIISWS